MMLFLELFWTFFIIGAFTFGGGYAMLSLIQTQVVDAHAWLSESAFTDIVAISQMTPGPVGINCATYVGYDVMMSAGQGPLISVLGSLTATLAIVLPSFLIMLTLARCYSRLRKSALYDGVMGAVRPAAVGLIFAAAFILCFRVGWREGAVSMSVVSDNFRDWKSVIIAAAALIAAGKFKVHPIIVIVVAGFLGILLY